MICSRFSNFCTFPKVYVTFDIEYQWVFDSRYVKLIVKREAWYYKSPTSVIEGRPWRKAKNLPYKAAIKRHRHCRLSQIGHGGCQKSATTICHGASMADIWQHKLLLCPGLMETIPTVVPRFPFRECEL